MPPIDEGGFDPGEGPEQIPIAEMGPIGQDVGMPPPPIAGQQLPISDVQQGARIGQVAGGLNIPPGATPPIMPEEPPPITMGQAPSGMADPSTQASERFNQFLESYPGYQSPSIAARIGASMYAAKDPVNAMKMLHAQPGLRAWSELVSPMQAAAREERYANQEARRIYQFERQQELREKKYQLQVFKAQNPNFTFKTDEDGQWVGIDPQDPSRSVPTGIYSGDLSDMENAELQLTNYGRRLEMKEPFDIRRDERREEYAGEREEERRARDVEIDRMRQERDEAIHQRRLAEIGARGEETRTTRAAPTYRDTHPEAAGVESQLDRARRYSNNARVAIANNPEWDAYITINADGSVSVEEEGYGWLPGGAPELTKNTRDRIMRAIYGTDYQPVAETPTERAQRTADRQAETAGNTIRVREESSGREGSWPADEELPEGYTRIP